MSASVAVESSMHFKSDDDDITSNATKDSRFVLMLGKPGGGKGTIAGKIVGDFGGFAHFSTGDALRQHVREQSTLGKQAKEFMDRGDLVPDELMIRLVQEGTDEFVNDGKSLLLDGFPRTLGQAKALDKELELDLVINLDVPTETIVGRISDRWIHPSSGRVYSYSYKPPKVRGVDDETGEPLVQREDDKPESVRRRLQAYDDVTAPLVEYYTSKGILATFHGTMSDVIYPDVKEAIDELLFENE